MTNEAWINERLEHKYMGDEQDKIKIAVIEERLNKHDILLQDLQEVKTNVALLVQRFANFQPNCPMHQLQMDNFSKRVETLETKVEGHTKKILIWSGGLIVITFLITNLLIPYVLNNFKVSSSTPKTELRN